MNGRSSDYLLVPRPSQQRQAVQWPTDIQDCSGGSQQRDCPGLPPGSLFIRTAGEPHRNQFAAKLRIIFEISPYGSRNFCASTFQKLFHHSFYFTRENSIIKVWFLKKISVTA